MKVERAVPNKPTVSVDVKQHIQTQGFHHRAQELCESRDGRPRLPVPNKPHGFCGCKATLNQIESKGCHPELRSCVKVKVAVPGSPSLISLMVFVDEKHHERGLSV